MIRTAWPHDLAALRDLFARANDTPYDLAKVAEEKCFGSGIAGEPVARVIDGSGRIDAAAVTCGKWLRLLIVDRDQRNRGYGSALLSDAEERGAHVIFAEPGNYFTPGVVITDKTTALFFHKRGYIETRWTHNLDVDLAAIAEPGDGVIRPAHAESDRVLDFVEREFGRIWRFEVAHAFTRDEPAIFYAEHEGEIAGFAAHDVNNHGLGWFGPTGVKASLRGLGIGRKVLLASLADLRRIGYSRAVIPWTDAIDFYRKSCGAEPAHRFIAFAKHRP